MDQTFFSLRQIKLFQILLGQDQSADGSGSRETWSQYEDPVSGNSGDQPGTWRAFSISGDKNRKRIRLSGDRESFAAAGGNLKRDSSLFYYTKEQRRALLTIEFLKRKHIEKLGYYAI